MVFTFCSKKCPICNVVFHDCEDIGAIVAHSASCVHSFCEKNNLQHCMCFSCSNYHKPAKRAKLEHQERGSFFEVIEPVSRYFGEVNQLLTLSTLSRKAFLVVKSIAEQQQWFHLKGYKHYNPTKVIAYKVEQLDRVPKSAKQVWFNQNIKHKALGTAYSLRYNFPNVVTRISLSYSIPHHEVLHWPSSLTQLEHPNCTAYSLSTLPPTVKYMEIGHKLLETIFVASLPAALTVLKVIKGPFAFAQFPSSLEFYESDSPRTEPPLPPLPPSLKVLGIGSLYAHPISLPPTLEQLQIVGNYAHPLKNFPPTLKSIFVDHHNHPLPPLPPHLTTLTLPKEFNQSIGFPTSLQSLDILSTTYTAKLPTLPNLTSLSINSPCCERLPSSLKHLTVGNYGIRLPHPLPPTLKTLTLEHSFGVLPKLPATLQSLTLGNSFTGPLPSPLPPNLTTLQIGDKYNHAIGALPDSLQYLTIGNSFDSSLPSALPSSLEILEIGKSYSKQLFSLPEHLHYLTVGYKCSIWKLSPNLIHLTINCARTDGVRNKSFHFETDNGCTVTLNPVL